MNQKKIKFLLVERDLPHQKKIAKILKSLNTKRVYRATDIKVAFALFTKKIPDIVIISHDNASFDGVKLANKIKQTSQYTSILFITESKQFENIKDIIDEERDSFILKPVKKKKLIQAVTMLSHQIILQKKLRASDRLLNQYKHAIDIIASVTKTDPKGIITYVNDAFCKMSGYSKAELLGHRHSMLRHPDTSNLIYKNLWKTISKKEVWKGQLQNINKNGQTYYEASVIIPILDEDGKIVEYIAINHDVTEMCLHKKQLEKRIDEEVQKNIRLIKAQEEQKIYEEKFAVMGQMAAGITHEINTPLTYIKGNLEVMRYDIDDLNETVSQKADLQKKLQTAFDGLNRVAGIVESMREIASQKSGQIEHANIYECMVVSLTLANTKSSRIANITLQGEQFDPKIDKSRYRFYAEIQKQRIEQMFIIIINNAIDAIGSHIADFEERMLKIDITEDDKQILITFQDNGGGINEALLPHIFEPFRSTKKEGGMGLGLNVAKRIIDDHNARIKIINFQNGTKIDITIPKQIMCSLD
jgi:PAS domain S-box-containing protein